MYYYLRSKDVPILGYCDNAADKWGQSRHGAPVFSPSGLKARLQAGELVCISCSPQRAVAEQLRELGINENAIYPYLSSIFSDYYRGEILQAHADDIAELRNRLMDEESKTYLDHLVAFRKGMDPFALRSNRHQTGVYQYKGLWPRLPASPRILDVGAFTGDTARIFLERTGGKAEVFSFEPLRQNYDSLTTWVQDEHLQDQVHAEHALVGSRHGESQWLFGSDMPEGDRRASSSPLVALNDRTLVPMVSLDEYVREHSIGRIDLIKMDIEGAELDALEGAVGIIERDRPFLAISGYHHPADLWEIPHFIQSRFPFYRLAAGHDSRVHFEIEFYCFPN